MDARGTVSERVAFRVAEARGDDVLDLPPLFDAVDPEALDAIIERMVDGSVTFTYAGRRVTVESSGQIHVGSNGRVPNSA